MKVICGGGGVNANGDRYELPTTEREVADDAIEKAAWAIWENIGLEKKTIMASASAHRIFWDFMANG